MSEADPNPLRDFEDRIERMDRRMREEAEGFDGEPSRVPPADVTEADDEFRVAIDLPGFDADEVSLLLSYDLLYVAARREARADGDEEYVNRERDPEEVARTIALPKSVGEGGVSASLDNGVLTVTLPKGAAETETDGGSTWIPVA